MARYKYGYKKERDQAIMILSYVLIFVIGLTIGVGAGGNQTNANGMVVIPSQDVLTASANIVAVRSTDNSGIVGLVSIEIHPGKGRVLMNTNPFVETDTQYSTETAVSIAARYTKTKLDDRDVILSFSNIPGQVVGGPSAGAAITAATIAAIEGKQVRKDVVVTGTIEHDGRIGWVGGILEKAQGSANKNISLFLVPKGQGILTYYKKEVKEQRIGYMIIQRINYIPEKIDLNDYTMSEFGMQTKEVATIDDVVKYLIE